MCLTFIIIVMFLVICIEIEKMASCYNGRTIIIKWVMIYNMRNGGGERFLRGFFHIQVTIL